MFLERPRLYCNIGEEDKKALQLLMNAGIPYIDLGPTSEEPTPFLEYGFWRFSRIKGIQEFISLWQKKELPPIDVCK